MKNIIIFNFYAFAVIFHLAGLVENAPL